MSGEEEKKCPLCVQEMDWTDQQLKPCQCGYQVCVWCWHHLMDMAEKDETEGRCPACRTPYDKDRIVGTMANCERVVVTKKDRKNKPQKVVKTTKPEAKKDLSNVRVIQRKMAYIIGLPLSLADEDVLQRKEYFGQYGKVTKVSLSRTAGGAIQQFVNDTCSVYITYSKEEEAIRCIQSVHGFGLDGRILRASFGTAKYCHAWLRNMPCTNPACLYLHSVGAEEDSFGKDEEAAVHTRNRVNQIVGATQNLQRRVGNMLPPPLDISCSSSSSSSSTATDKPIVRSTPKDIAQASVTSTSHLASSLSAGDKDGRNITCNKTFVDVIGQRSSQPERDGNIAEDRKVANLSSDFSFINIAKNHHPQTEYSSTAQHSVPYGNHSIAVHGNNDSREYSVKPFRESSEFSSGRANLALIDASYSAKGQCSLMSDSGRQVWPGSRSDAGGDMLYYDDQRSKGSDNLSQGSSLFTSSHPIRFSDSSDGYVQQHREKSSSTDLNGDCSSAYNHYNEASIPPYTCVNPLLIFFFFFFSRSNPLLIDGGNEMKFQTSTEPDRNYSSTGNLFSNEEIVEQLRRLDDDTVTNEDDIPALDAVENSIISNILSMDFDSSDESLNLPHNLAGLLDGNSGRHGSWNFRNSDESRFSFAKDDKSVNQISDADSLFSNMGQVPRKYSSVPGSTDNKEQFMRGSLHHVRAQSSVPPGFAVPSTKAPPGFSTFERPNHLTATSGSYSIKTCLPTNQNYAAAAGGGGHSNSSSNFDYMGVDRSKGTHTYNYPGLEMRPTSAPESVTYQGEARQWLMMQQQSSSPHQDQNYHHHHQDNTQSSTHHHQKLRAYGRSDSFSSFGDSYRLSSGMGDHQNGYNPSSYSHFSQQQQQQQQQQQYGNGNGNSSSHMSNGYGTSSVLDDVVESSRGGDIHHHQRSDRLGGGLNYYSSSSSSGYGGGDMRLQMPSNGNVYNRVYGL